MCLLLWSRSISCWGCGTKVPVPLFGRQRAEAVALRVRHEPAMQPGAAPADALRRVGPEVHAAFSGHETDGGAVAVIADPGRGFALRDVANEQAPRRVAVRAARQCFPLLTGVAIVTRVILVPE